MNSIGKKLYLSFTVTFLIICIISWNGISKMNTLNEKTNTITSDMVPSIESLANINYFTEHIITMTYQHVFSVDDTTMIEAEKELADTEKKLGTDLEKFENLLSSENEKEIFQAFMNDWEAFETTQKEVVIASKGNDDERAGALLAEAAEEFKASQIHLDQLLDINHEDAKSLDKSASESYQMGKMQTFILLAIALLLNTAVALYMNKIITNPIKFISKLLNKIANGDLKVEKVRVKTKDEIAVLGNAVNQMASSLQGLIGEIKNTSEHVVSASEELTASASETSRATEQITSTIQEVATGTENQVKSVDDCAASIERLSNGIEQVASSAHNVNITMDATLEKSDNGNKAVQNAINQMDSVNKSVDELSVVIKGLGARSQEIGNILDVITDISAQTNLLALNAAIEAARAGEQGRGFAVVADEVRKLAEQSANSAQQISGMISVIQEETKFAVQSMTSTVQEVSEGIATVNIANESFEEIQQAIKGVSQQILDVTTSSEQMSVSIEEINKVMNLIIEMTGLTATGTQNITSATEEQLSSMEEITASAISLSQMSEKLQEYTLRFKV
ncbi:methyl-accepting chemotaxis protein [Metabacillus fastidiosus]|uniref:methyl-accepting chemotaxis protein n=1 Tax=Metabacillus fastidiosus TaxID=1458 RepID=UPI003D2DA978